MLAFASMAIAGCQEAEPEYNPGIEFTRTGEVNLVAAMENAAVTKASLVGTGEARWLEGDRISVICTDGSSADLNLDGTGGTRKAFFKGEIPSGKTMGDYAYYPAAPTSGGKIQYTLPTEIVPGNEGTCALMVAEITDSFEIEFKQAVSYLNIKIDNIDPNIKVLEIEADKCIAGTFLVDLSTVIETGISATDQSKKVKVSLAGLASTNLNLFLPVPSGEYKSISAVGYNGKGEEATRGEFLTTSTTLERGEYKTVSTALPPMAASTEPVTIELPMTEEGLPEGFPTSLAESGLGDEKSFAFDIDEVTYLFAFDPDAAGQNQKATQNNPSIPGYYFDTEKNYFILGCTYGYIKFPALNGMRLQSVTVNVANDRTSGANPIKSCVIRETPETAKVGNEAFFSFDGSGPVYLSAEDNTNGSLADVWEGPEHTWEFDDTKANTSYCFQSRNGQIWLSKLVLVYVPVE